MKCPVCSLEMLAHDAPDARGDSFTVDRCTGSGRCGVWYDRGEYGALNPRLAEPAVRDALLASVRMPTGATDTAPPCPRCTANGAPRRLVPVTFVGVRLGVCDGCGGVWAPHGAIEAVSNALALHSAGSGEMLATGYRTAAAAPVMRDNGTIRTRCVQCGQAVALDETMLSERGLLCVLCGANEAARDDEDRGVVATLWSMVQYALRDHGMR